MEIVERQIEQETEGIPGEIKVVKKPDSIVYGTVRG
jgi:hypothetical protein